MQPLPTGFRRLNRLINTPRAPKSGPIHLDFDMTLRLALSGSPVYLPDIYAGPAFSMLYHRPYAKSTSALTR